MPIVQDALEKGYFQGTFARAAGSAWGHLAAKSLAKTLHVPARIRLVTVGGATLGGSGKTPVAIAWARRERERRETVALIGHAYRARPLRARIVRLDDDVHEVGDEALVAARELCGIADVVVAPTRQEAVDFAIGRGATSLVVDGVLQTTPRRADVAVLAIDSAATRAIWCPPAGDLRAPMSALMAASDVVIDIGDEDAPAPFGRHRARVVSDGVRAFDGSLVGYEELALRRIGLALSVAHPERIVARLERRGVKPVAFAYVGDHLGARLRTVMQRVSRVHTDIDAWVTTAKCAAFACPCENDPTPLYIVIHRVVLPAALP